MVARVRRASDGDRARAFADQWDVERAHTDHRDLLEGVDAVVIASTNDSHAPIARDAIEAGVHLLLEKPVALHAADAAEIATAARVAGLTTMVPFTYRWMPANRFVKRLIDEGVVVWTENEGVPGERRVIVCRGVRELLEGEIANGLDDNGNGLIDEPGFCVQVTGEVVTLRLTLDALDSDNRVLTKTVESSIWIRN